MTEVTTPPPGSGDRVEPVDIQVEMQRSYLDYAMSVIVGRALPDVRDGLKPVHRRVLYAMYDGGYRPDRGYVKCARVVGDVMGNYHPHGDSAIYDTLVRLAQPWSMRQPLVDGNGNFGSQGDDPPAAMRYCVVGETRVRLTDGASVPIAELHPGVAPNSDTPLDVKLLDRNGDPVLASMLFHSGEHPTLRLRTREGYELTGTANHPVLCLVNLGGVPSLWWQTLDEIQAGDYVVLSRVPESGEATATPEQLEAAEVAGRSAAKRVPEFVWRSSAAVKRRFLAALFEGDGSSSRLPRGTVQVSYSTRSARLAAEVQQLLLEFGVVSRQCRYDNGEVKVYLGNRRDARLFARNVGFLGRKQAKLEADLAALPESSGGLSSDHVPFLSEFLRTYGGSSWADRDWLNRHNVDRVERWERDRDELRRRIGRRELLEVAEPLVDGRYYYAQVASVTASGTRPVYSVRVDSDDHSFQSDGFVSHNTECRLAPLAMEMLRDIDQETVDFVPNYDGRAQEPIVLPSRIPNLLVNGAAGIAVGMATNIPPHNLREVASAVHWFLEHPDADNETLLAAAMERIPGPDFPTGALIVGRDGIEDAYRTGRGSVRMRAVVEIDEDRRGRPILVVTELPYQVNKDALLRKIGELVDDGRVTGIAELADEGSTRTGLRLVVTLKRDAVARVVLNNLYKHTQLQDTFGCNVVALVDGVPRTLNLAELVRYYVAHQIEVIVRRTRYQLRKAEERAHILRALLKALDALDEVIALIRNAESAEAARGELMSFLDIDEVQATAILDMQLRRLAALERQRIIDEFAELTERIADLQAILDSPDRQRQIIGTELGEIVGKYAHDRVTRIIPYEGDMSLEDLIVQEDVVVTISRGGYAKRTKTALYRAQRRGGKGVQGAQLREDDIVEHFFVTSTHNWILFFTNKGRVYRAKAHELPEMTRAARGQHVANILAFQPDERIASVIDITGYDVAPYLVLATKRGLVKKTPLSDFDSTRTGGVIAINLREDDELIAAALSGPADDLLLVSRGAHSIRFHADDDALRPMGRATSGVIGMRFAEGDELLAMEVVRDNDGDVLVATDGGYAKRTRIDEYPLQGRGGKGVLTAKIVAKRGQLVGAMVVRPDEEIYAITSSGGVIRTQAREVRRAQRQTMGVRLINLPEGDTVVAVARNAEPEDGEQP